MGKLTRWEMHLLHRLTTKLGWIPEHTFFIDTPFLEAAKRTNKRGRPAEQNIPLEYLRQLEIRHRAFMKSGVCGKVHILDGTLKKGELVQMATSIIADIHNSKRAKPWKIPVWLLSFVEPPEVDRENSLKTLRLALGPLPFILSQSMRKSYVVSPDRGARHSPKGWLKHGKAFFSTNGNHQQAGSLPVPKRSGWSHCGIPTWGVTGPRKTKQDSHKAGIHQILTQRRQIDPCNINQTEKIKEPNKGNSREAWIEVWVSLLGSSWKKIVIEEGLQVIDL